MLCWHLCVLAKPNKVWRVCIYNDNRLCIGWILGYLIGKFSFDYIEPFIEKFGYMIAYQDAVNWFNDWGFWAILIAGFSPIPYKVFTIAAGALNMAFYHLLLAQ